MCVSSYSIMTKFRDNLRKLMGIYGLNQVELAKKSGVPQSLISQHLSGHPNVQTPSLKTLVALARALNCTLEELTGLESLRGIEKKVEAVKDGASSLSPKGREFAHLYNSITDESKKELIEAMIIKAAESKIKSESHDKEDSENKDKK